MGIELHINWQRQQKTVLSVCSWRYSFQSHLSILLYIVSNHITRPEITGTDIFSQLVRFIYSVDAPVNLFPSIHCLESWCCIRAAYKMNFKTEKRTNYYRVATILMSLGIFASTLFIKQHVIADVFGGIAAFEIGMILAKILICEDAEQTNS